MRERDEVVEPRLAGDLLPQEPAHLLERRVRREKRKERVPLTGTAFAQRLEPGDEPLRIGGSAGRLRGGRGALRLDVLRFERAQLRLVSRRLLVGKRRAQPPLRISREAQMEVSTVHSTKL